MKKTILPVLIILWALTAASQAPQLIAKISERHITITVYYCACTDGGDYSVDSGQVIVPEQLRQAYIDERCKRAKLYGSTREVISKRLALNGYKVWNLRATSLTAWDSLFTPNVHIAENKAQAIQSEYWRRRYRLTGTVIGLKGHYLVFKVQKALRIKDQER